MTTAGSVRLVIYNGYSFVRYRKMHAKVREREKKKRQNGADATTAHTETQTIVLARMRLLCTGSRV